MLPDRSWKLVDYQNVEPDIVFEDLKRGTPSVLIMEDEL